MMRLLPRWLVLFLLLVPACTLRAEKVADLPMPTRYVNDFAGVLTPAGTRQIEALSRAVHDQANADLALVIIKQLDDNQSVEEFTAALEEKWKLGKKGEDRSAIYVIVLNPHKLRIETGYGLEGILNDAKVGAILDTAIPYLRRGDYDSAGMAGIQGLADVVAADAHVTLTPIAPRMSRRRQQAHFGLPQVVLGLGALFVLIVLVRTGNIGWAFFLLQSLLGGGGGGRDDDDRGGGWGGFGGSSGGESGGGGASRDW